MMSVDLLQKRIRKFKNPTVVDFTASAEMLPPVLLKKHDTWLEAYDAFCRNMLCALKDVVPAVRFRFSTFSLYGNPGIIMLRSLLLEARERGYYVFLDCVQILSAGEAEQAAEILFDPESIWAFHGLIVSTYIGSDGLKPFVRKMKGTDKSLFGVVRTGNKSCSELQDLLTGNRLSHTAAADLVNRMGETMIGSSGYQMIGALAGASSADSIRTLRSKYSRLFLLLDSIDDPGANFKVCSLAFDKFGHGAAVCAGEYVISAWRNGRPGGDNYLDMSLDAVARIKINLNKYITIL